MDKAITLILVFIALIKIMNPTNSAIKLPIRVEIPEKCIISSES